MVLPVGQTTLNEDVEVIEAVNLPTKTYKLDIRKGRCIGMTDGIEAMEQAIFKVLNTIRFEHIIYSDDYGFEGIIGKDEVFVRAELPRRIKETLLQDERITGVEDLTMGFQGDQVLVNFTVITIYGDVKVLKEVNAYV